jgi:putative nucleotidyltransferase with HDIG domain
MIELKIREVQKALFNVFDLGPLVTEYMLKVIADSENAEDYEEIFKHDRFFTETICRQASASMKTSVVSSLGHGVVLVGEERVRDMILGHTIERIFSPHADNAFKGWEDSAKLLKYAQKAEEQAQRCKNEYVGMAFAAGLVFDIFSRWISADQTTETFFRDFFERTWRHSLTSATLAWGLATHERVLISHRKIIFASALLHDVGKLGLSLFAPGVYSAGLEKMKKLEAENPSDDSYEVTVERELFDLSHAEIGSSIVFQTKFLRDVENEIDFHHDSTLLRTRNPDAFLGAAVVNIADRMATLMRHKPDFLVEDLQEILKPHAASFPLKAHEVMSVFADLRGRTLLAV